MNAPHLAGDGRTVTVRIPISIRRRAGRKLVLAPNGTANTWVAPPRRIDSALVKALARAFRWRKLLETGVYGTVGEIAAAEKINPSYVSRVLRLTLLAPAIVEAILDGRSAITPAEAMRPLTLEWVAQARILTYRAADSLSHRTAEA
jgi:hypothetical protein